MTLQVSERKQCQPANSVKILNLKSPRLQKRKYNLYEKRGVASQCIILFTYIFHILCLSIRSKNFNINKYYND